MSLPDNISLIRKALESELEFSGTGDSEQSWRKLLAERINELINSDFNKLAGILYRIDVSEAKLKQLLREYRCTDAGEIIGNMLVERQLQKIISRKQYGKNDAGISDHDKW